MVSEINQALRSLHLNLQGSKTEILSGDALDAVLSSSESVAIDQVWEKLENFDPQAHAHRTDATRWLRTLRPLTSQFRSGLPESVHALAPRASRLFRRLMTVYGRCGRPWLRSSAMAALSEPPELRMLQKCVRYLTQLPYALHAEIAVDLLDMLEKEIFPIPYQSAIVLDALRHLHPEDGGRSLAARIRRYALDRKRDWPIRQKALEAMASLPYRADHAVSVANRLLTDDHPWVRRAACILLSRGETVVVRETVTDLVYRPDRAIGPLALWFHRHLHDPSFAMKEVHRLQKGALRDDIFVHAVPRLWVLRCSTDQEVVLGLRKHLAQYVSTRSSKVEWHLKQLNKLTG